MQPLRRWSPQAPKPAAPAPQARAANDLTGPLATGVTDQDLAFCAEFAANGGIATSDDGFKAEADLLRMQASGLLDLIRSDEAPYGIIRVRLKAGAADDDGLSPTPAPPAEARRREEKRHGFEIARGMIGAAIKAELSSTGDGLPPALAARLMDRISRMPMPF